MATITGKLINPTEGGAAVANYPVRVVPRSFSAPSGQDVTLPISKITQSDTNGLFTLNLIGPGTYMVYAGYKPEQLIFILMLMDNTNQDIGDVATFISDVRVYIIGDPISILYMKADNGVIVPITIKAVDDGQGGYIYVPQVQ